MAAALIRRAAWPAAAALAFAFLVALALHGTRPEAGLVSFKAAGFLKQFAPEAAAEVEITTPAGRKRFRRADGWPSRIDEALRLLRDSGPQRVMTADEVAAQSLTSYGLDEGATIVAVRSASGETFTIRFGRRNPLGSGRYARIDGLPGVPILPAYVGDTWEQIGR